MKCEDPFHNPGFPVNNYKTAGIGFYDFGAIYMVRDRHNLLYMCSILFDR